MKDYKDSGFIESSLPFSIIIVERPQLNTYTNYATTIMINSITRPTTATSWRGLFSVCLLAAVSSLLAQPLPVAPPEKVGFSSQRLKRIDQFIQRQMQDGQLVGAVALVARQGKLIYSQAFGKADVERGKPLDKDAIFRIYSMTKPVTTVSAMMLYEDGRFQLNDPVHRYLPAFKNLKVYVDNGKPEGGREVPNRAVTIRDLMAHTSGLTYGLFGDSTVDRLYRQANPLDRSGTLKDMVDKLGELPLMFHPGERWQYSVATDVLGRLVELVSGQRLDRFFQERIFTPLGMKDTAFFVPADKLGRFPVNYRWSSDLKRSIADHPSSSSYRNAPSFLSGGGGLVSTAQDYLRFCQMLLNEGELDGTRLLGAKSVQLMTLNHIDDAVTPATGVTLGSGAGFGLGFRVILDLARSKKIGSAGSYSWGGMASTAFFIDPQEQLIGILMTQKFPTDLRARDEFQTAVYQAIIEKLD